jgi:hypothetical protein
MVAILRAVSLGDQTGQGADGKNRLNWLPIDYSVTFFHWSVPGFVV